VTALEGKDEPAVEFRGWGSKPAAGTCPDWHSHGTRLHADPGQWV